MGGKGKMEETKIFKSEEFGEVRTAVIDGEAWFVGKDVADILGYQNGSRDINAHVDDEDRRIIKSTETVSLDIPSRGMLLINESGLYSLILSSNMPNAKKFKKWVTSEVLPSIRKHGIYATDNVIDNILNNPDFGIELLTKLKEERAARVEAEKKNAILTHVNKTYTMTEIAKELNLKSAVELNKILADKKIQYKVNGTWVLYSDYSNLGYEDIKQEVLDNGRVIYHRKITQMGRAFILGLFEDKAS
jgi:prophage antirepressor-like protein